MRVEDWHFHHNRFVAGNFVLYYFVGSDTPKTDNRLALDHAEFFLLTGMIVITPDNSGLCGRKENLAAFVLFDNLEKAASFVRCKVRACS